MVTTNIDTIDGLANGSTGILKRISYSIRNKKKIAKLIWIDFGDEEIGTKAREKYKHIAQRESIEDNLTPIASEFRTFRCGLGQVKRMQFPLIPAFAITIHKSQGGTYEFVVVHLDGLNRQLLYVACSRVTKSSGLYLIGKFVPPKPPANNDIVMNELKRLENECGLDLVLIHPEDINNAYLKFGFLELNQLENRIDEITADKNFNFDVILIKTKSKESVSLPNYELAFNNECNGENYLVYSKNITKVDVLVRSHTVQIDFLNYSIIYCNVNDKTFYSFINEIKGLNLQTKSNVVLMGYLYLSDKYYDNLHRHFIMNNFSESKFTQIEKPSSFCYMKTHLTLLHDVYDCYFSNKDCIWIALIDENISKNLNKTKECKSISSPYSLKRNHSEDISNIVIPDKIPKVDSKIDKKKGLFFWNYNSVIIPNFILKVDKTKITRNNKKNTHKKIKCNILMLVLFF